MYKVRIMISIFQGMPRKILGSYTLVAGFLICQYTFQYTSCILCVTGGILGGMYTEFYTCGRIPYMSVHISVYIMYTVCNRRYTGRYVEGVYTEFYSCGKVPSSSGFMPVYSMYTGKIKRVY